MSRFLLAHYDFSTFQLNRKNELNPLVKGYQGSFLFRPFRLTSKVSCELQRNVNSSNVTEVRYRTHGRRSLERRCSPLQCTPNQEDSVAAGVLVPEEDAKSLDEVEEVKANDDSSCIVVGLARENLDNVRELLRSAEEVLENTRKKSEELEAEAQQKAEISFALTEAATLAEELEADVSAKVEELASEEELARERLVKAEKAFEIAQFAFEEARTELNASPRELLDQESEEKGVVEESKEEDPKDLDEKPESPLPWRKGYDESEDDLKEKEDEFLYVKSELERIGEAKKGLQQQLTELRIVARAKREKATKAEKQVASAMAAAEKAVRKELEASLRVTEAQLALERAERLACEPENEEKLIQEIENLRDVLTVPSESDESGAEEEEIEESSVKMFVQEPPEGFSIPDISKTIEEVEGKLEVKLTSEETRALVSDPVLTSTSASEIEVKTEGLRTGEPESSGVSERFSKALKKHFSIVFLAVSLFFAR